MKCKFIAVMTLLLCLLTGCGKEDAYAGPVFGDTCSGYDGFQYLEEAQLETMDETMTLFLPKGLTMSPQKSKKGNTCDGIGVQIGQIASSGGETLSPRQCREWVRQVCEADGISRASGFHISYPKHISDTACAVPVSYYEIFGKHLKVDRTCYFQKLDNGSVLYVMVQVAEDETTEKTEGIIREMENFYPFSIAYDRKKIHRLAETAQRMSAPDRYIRIHLRPVSEETCREIRRLGDLSLLLRDKTDEHRVIDYKNPQEVRLRKAKLITMWARELGKAWRYRIYFAYCDTYIYVAELGKDLF